MTFACARGLKISLRRRQLERREQLRTNEESEYEREGTIGTGLWCGVVRKTIGLLGGRRWTFWVRARVARSRFEVAALGSRAGCTSTYGFFLLICRGIMEPAL